MIFQPEFIAALAIGFFGSLHCVGMCGPIALVTPSIFPGTWGRVLSGFIYNTGRILTYAFLGLLVGLIGRGVNLFKGQQVISIILGAIIVLSVLAPRLMQRIPNNSLALQWNSKIKVALARFLKKSSIHGVFSIGLVNGLLPCGLVYLGLAGSLDQADAQGGAMFMTFFGLGTIPMMTGVHLAGYNLKGSLKNKISRILPVFIVFMGLLLILRGLGLGIPYLSPSMEPHTGDVECHSPAHRHPY